MSMKQEDGLTELFRQTQSELDSQWQAGCLEFIRRHRPKLNRQISEQEALINRLWAVARNDRSKREEFALALDGWTTLLLNGLKEFIKLNRP